MEQKAKVTKILSILLLLVAALFFISNQTYAEEKIDINKASIKELQRLEGIGKTLASRIIEYRTVNGPFQDTKDIMKIDGIGKLTFEKISGQIIAEPEANVVHSR